MDAGLSAIRNPGGTGHRGSSQAQMRNQLLQSDIGNLDIRYEIPNQPSYSGRGSQQYFSNQPEYTNPQFRGLPPQQPQGNPQQPFNRVAYPSYPPMGANMGPPAGPRMGPQIPQYQSTHGRNSSMRPGSQMTQGQAGRRAYSLNQKSLSSFFKGPKFLHGKGKPHSNKDDYDDDEDVILEDNEQAMLTLHDIKTSGNRGGESYGHGTSTAPMIPVTMTKDHGNMTNMEYRKHLFAQRKMAMNAVNKQQKGMPYEPRAMSLQTYNNESPFIQGRMAPHPQGSSPIVTNRANSLMRGPESIRQQPQQPQQQYKNYSPHDIPRYNSLPSNGPRSMSLLTPQPGRQAGSAYQMPGQVQASNEFLADRQPRTEMYMAKNASWSSDNESKQYQTWKSSDTSSSNPSKSFAPSNSAPSVGDFPSSTFHTEYGSNTAAPLNNQLNVPPLTQAKGQLNVLKLSAPQQNELEAKARLLSQKEKDLKDKELRIREKEASFKNGLLESRGGSVDSVQQEESRTVLPHSSQTEQEIVNEKDERDERDDGDDLDIQPQPSLEVGLGSLSLHSRDNGDSGQPSNRISNATFVSTFSESPQKVNVPKKSTGMYKLEKSANNSIFVTAQEFPNDMENRSDTSRASTGKEFSRKDSPNTSTDSIDDGNSTLKGSIGRVDASKESIDRKNSNASSGAKLKKRTSFVKAKNFLRKMSSSSPTKGGDEDSQLALRRSPTNISIDSLPSSNNDTFHYRTQNKKTDNRISVLSASSKKMPDDQQNSSILETDTEGRTERRENSDVSDPDGFDFDNTLGKPYEPLFAVNKDIDTKKFRTITISGEQLNILNENKLLMQEITLVSTELAESIKRETILESQLKDLAHNNFSLTENDSTSLAEFEIELRKKSAKIVQLIQQLNDERLKRFIAEEQLLLQENGAKPSSIDLVHTISTLNTQLQDKNAEISMLRGALENNTTIR